MILAVMLVTLMPATALAAKPTSFNASGTITYISPGTVFPAGKSDRWVVAERELTGSLSGDISGDFTMTYKANVESVQTQAGNLHGRLEVSPYVLEVNGELQPAEFVGWFAPGIPLYQGIFNGRWTFTQGARGNGDFDACVIFVPTPEGHVGYIVDGDFTMSGQWQP